MLEYVLIRPTDRSLLHQATRALKFLAVDELHVYRGRQGADVAMLMRRVRQRAGRDDLLCIGTSATLATSNCNATRARIGEVGSRFFGVTIRPDNVIDEKLRATRHGRGANDRRRCAQVSSRRRPSRQSRQLQAIRLRLGWKRHSGSQLPLMGAWSAASHWPLRTDRNS